MAFRLLVLVALAASKCDALPSKTDLVVPEVIDTRYQSAWFAHRFGAAGNDDASRLLKHDPHRLHFSHDQVRRKQG